MWMITSLMSFIFPPSPSFFITAMSVVSVASLANAGFSETRGKHLKYSKFTNSTHQKQNPNKNIQISSKNGMLLLYTPAFLAGAASFFVFPDEGLRFLLVRSALTIHFFKRVFEVLFVHKYSGTMDIEAAILIPISYLVSTVTMIYAQHLTQGLPDPLIDLKIPGIVIFLIGISGNFYHHYLLSKLREDKKEKEYKIPKGGFFDFVICPHYLFEILGFIGISFISQTLYALSFALGTTFYLMGRSYATRRWYVLKFENFPNDVKALIPFVF